MPLRRYWSFLSQNKQRAGARLLAAGPGQIFQILHPRQACPPTQTTQTMLAAPTLTLNTTSKSSMGSKTIDPVDSLPAGSVTSKLAASRALCSIYSWDYDYHNLKHGLTSSGLNGRHRGAFELPSQDVDLHSRSVCTQTIKSYPNTGASQP